jgi:hypothetical protein
MFKREFSKWIVGEQRICRVRGSYTSDYVEYNIVECSIVQFARDPPTLWANISAIFIAEN